jgi:hypothetical protein
MQIAFWQAERPANLSITIDRGSRKRLRFFIRRRQTGGRKVTV